MEEPDPTLIRRLGSEFGERNRSNISWACLELGERAWPNPGSVFGSGERNRLNPGSTGSKLGERNWPNLSSAGSEFGEKTRVRVKVRVKLVLVRTPNLQNQGLAWSSLRTLKLQNQGSALSFLRLGTCHGTSLSPNSEPAEPGFSPVHSQNSKPVEPRLGQFLSPNLTNQGKTFVAICPLI